jgi:hypothetical protein
MGTKKPLLFPKSRKTAKNGTSGNKSFVFVPKNAFPGTELQILFPGSGIGAARKCSRTQLPAALDISGTQHPVAAAGREIER